MKPTYEIPEDLLSRCAGQAAICRRVVQKYVQQMESDVVALADLINHERASELAKLAHRMKGASANVAAAKLYSLATKIEQLANQDDLSPIKSAFLDLQREWTEYERLTKQFVTEDTQPCGS